MSTAVLLLGNRLMHVGVTVSLWFRNEHETQMCVRVFLKCIVFDLAVQILFPSKYHISAILLSGPIYVKFLCPVFSLSPSMIGLVDNNNKHSTVETWLCTVKFLLGNRLMHEAITTEWRFWIQTEVWIRVRIFLHYVVLCRTGLAMGQSCAGDSCDKPILCRTGPAMGQFCARQSCNRAILCRTGLATDQSCVRQVFQWTSPV
jgi:hypothetical protein